LLAGTLVIVIQAAGAPAMELTPMHRRVIALDVHQAKINACAIVEHDDGRVEITRCDFGAFKRDRRALAQWALQIGPEVVVMESTGVYWKSPFSALEAVGIVAWMINARHGVFHIKWQPARAQAHQNFARTWPQACLAHQCDRSLAGGICLAKSMLS
jgi:hypothetical protein